MSDKILVPALGESVTEATVSKWLKTEGEKVNADEPVVELETDKVNVEVPAPLSGTLEKISVKEGQTVNVGSLLGTVGKSKTQNKEKVEEPKNYEPPKKVEKEEAFILKKNVEQKKHQKQAIKEKIIEPLVLTEVHEEKKLNIQKTVSPAARKLASEKKN